MRILIPCLHYFKDSPSGGTRLAYDEAVTLSQLGHEVWLIAHSEQEKYPEYEWDKEAKVHVLRYSIPKSNLNIFHKFLAHQRATKELLLKSNLKPFDIIHGHSILQLYGAMQGITDDVTIGYSIHSPVLLEYRGAGYQQPLLKRIQLEIRGRLLTYFERQILKKSHFITSDSLFTKYTMTRLYGQEIGERIVHIPGWVNIGEYSILGDSQHFKQELGWSTDRPVFFTLRRLTPRNGLQTLLEAINILNTKGYEFEVVIGGTGPLEKTLREMTKQLQIDHLVTFAGYVPEEDLPKMYRAADMFVLPTARLECFGLIILESFAAGKGVIGTPVGAIPELIEPVEPTWIVEENNAYSLARKMGEYLDGKLPIHSSQFLQDYAMQFDKPTVVARLIDYVMNQVQGKCEPEGN